MQVQVQSDSCDFVWSVSTENIANPGNDSRFVGRTSRAVNAWLTLMNIYLSTLAYLDPGTGSMLLQAIVGGSAGLYVFVRHLWRSFRYANVKPTTEIAPIEN